MEYALDLPELPGRRVAVQTAGAFSGPKQLVDGMPVARERGRHIVPDAQGGSVEIRIKPRLLDTVPDVQVNGRLVHLTPPLRWYEYVWACLPVILVFVGGAIGGAFGAAAAYGNVAVFRSEVSPPLRYLITGLISLGALLGFALLASLFSAAVRR